jgi:hypothetical protein
LASWRHFDRLAATPAPGDPVAVGIGSLAVGLFGDKGEKRAREAAARAESERLAGLPVAELAAAVLPAFGPDGIGAGGGHQQGAIQVTEWLFASTSTKVKYRQPVLGPVIEALQMLDNAGLLERRSFGGPSSNASTYHATRRGEEALADGSAARLLAVD